MSILINGYKVSTRPMNSWHPENTLFSGQMCSNEGQVLGARFTSNTFMDPKRTLKGRAGVGVEG
jgi:hypothetical protein